MLFAAGAFGSGPAQKPLAMGAEGHTDGHHGRMLSGLLSCALDSDAAWYSDLVTEGLAVFVWGLDAMIE